MFVILTSKPGQFRTEIISGLRPCERYDYLFYGEKKATFVIAELLEDSKLRVIDETPPVRINHVPSKFLPHFDSIESARAELAHLTHFGHMKVELARVG